MKEKKCKMKKNMAAMMMLKVILYIFLLTILNSFCIVNAEKLKPGLRRPSQQSKSTLQAKPSQPAKPSRNVLATKGAPASRKVMLSKRVQASLKVEGGKLEMMKSRTPLSGSMRAMVSKYKPGGDATCLCRNMVSSAMGGKGGKATIRASRQEMPKKSNVIEGKKEMFTCPCQRKDYKTMKPDASRVKIKPTASMRVPFTKRINPSKSYKVPMATKVVTKPDVTKPDNIPTTVCFNKDITEKVKFQKIFEKVKGKVENMVPAIFHIELGGGGELMVLEKEKWKPLVVEVAKAKLMKMDMNIKVKGENLFNGIIKIKFAFVKRQDKEVVDLKDVKEDQFKRLIVLTKPEGFSMKVKQTMVKKQINEDGGALSIKLSELAELIQPQYGLQMKVDKIPYAMEAVKKYEEMVSEMKRMRSPAIYLKRVDYALGRWMFHQTNPEEEGNENGGSSEQGGGEKEGDKKDYSRKFSIAKPTRSMITASSIKGGEDRKKDRVKSVMASRLIKTTKSGIKPTLSKRFSPVVKETYKKRPDFTIKPTKSQMTDRKTTGYGYKKRERRSLARVKPNVSNYKKLMEQKMGRPMGGNSYYDLSKTSKITFKPHPNKHGKSMLSIKFGYRNRMTRGFTTVATIMLTIDIKNTNDPPSVKKMMVYAPFIPYELKEESKGFAVEKLVQDKVLYDPDSRKIGIAIVFGGKSSFGSFQYKCKGKTWTEMNIKNLLPLGVARDRASIKALFLTPEDSIRFNVLKNKFWSKKDGFDKGSLSFLAWDMSNSKVCGERTLNALESAKGAPYLSHFRNMGRLIQLRRGCNKVPGTIPFFDSCNTCMGDNSTCKGCDGKINSKARYDKCMVCSGGDTDKIPNIDLDCAGTCNKSRIDKECNVCQVIGFKTPKDCNGDCLGRAVKNRCGVCVMGKTGKPFNSGMDQCGVCNGNNTSCLDCAKVPNGKNRTDLCGNCLQEDDPQFNSGCGPKLGKFYPMVIFKDKKGTTIEIKASAGVVSAEIKSRKRRNTRNTGKGGASNADAKKGNPGADAKKGTGDTQEGKKPNTGDIKKTVEEKKTSGGSKKPSPAIKKPSGGKEPLPKVECTFNDKSAAKISVYKKGPSLIIKAMVPGSLPAGEYTVSCSVNGVKATAEKKLKVLDLETIKVDKVTPDLSMVDSSEDISLTITGSGFVDSPLLACYYGSWRSKLKVKFVSNTEIKCILDKAKTKRSQKTDVIIKFGDKLTKGSKTNKLFATHKLAIQAPNAVEAKFNKKLTAVIITFDGNGKLPRGIGCKDLFPKHYTSFGSKARCLFISNRLIIYLIGKPTLRAGKITLDKTKILAQARVSTHGKLTEQIITIQPPELKKVKPLVLQIRGTKRVGICDKIKLQLSIPGGNPGRLKYAWSVRAHDDEGALDEELAKKLESLKDYVKRFKRSVQLPAKMTPFLGRSLTFSIKVTNFLDMETVQNFTVFRSNRTDPQVRLSRKKLTVKASQLVSIRAKAKVSSCIDLKSMSGKLFFQWEITPAVEIETEKMNSPRLVIPRRLLKGNTTYKVSVEVGMSDDPEISVKDEAIIQTLSSKLEPVVDGLQTVSISDMLDLSALKSFDPDGNREGFNVSYEWQVLNFDKSAVFRSDKKRVQLPEEPEVKINVTETFQPRRRYLIMLKYRVGARIATKIHRLRVVAGSPPKIRMRTQAGVKNPSNKITILASIRDSLAGTYEWKCEEVDNTEDKTYGMVDLETVNLTKIEGRFRRGRSLVALKFARNSLAGGTYYRFNLTATNRFNVTASAVFEFKTNSIPTQGMIEVEPSRGIAMNTSFNISALEGWTDPDGDELKFIYFYRIGKSAPSILEPRADDSYWLPPGNITIYVRCIDIYGGYSQATANVIVERPTEVNDTAVEEEFNKLKDEQNLKEATGLSSTFISTVKEEMNDRQKELQENMLKMMCDDSVSLDAEDEKRNMAEGFAAVTAGAGVDLNPDTKECIIKKLRKALGMEETQQPTSSPESRRRRRRDLTPAPTVEEKTPDEVEVDLKTFSNLISPTSYDSETMKNKADMLSALHTLTAGMCKGYAVGEAAGIAENELVHLQTLQKDFTDVDTQQIKLGKSSDYMKSADYVILGGMIKNLTGCGESKSDACQSACVSSWQMKYDLFSEGSNGTLRSNVLSIKLWDSSTHAHIDLTGATIDMSVDIVVTDGNKNKSTNCHLWDTTSNRWVQDGVETVKTESVVSLNNASHEVVTCKMSKLAHLVLVEGDDKVAPTEDTGTTKMITGTNGTTSTGSVNTTESTNTNATGGTDGSNTTTPTQTPETGSTKALTKENYPHFVEFKLTYDKTKCEEKLKNDKTAFTTEIQTQVSNMLSSKGKINKDRLSKFELRCGSIIVKFQVAHATGDSFTVATTMDKIKDMISKGEMKVTIDGKEVLADKDSYAAVLHPDYVQPVKKDEGLSVGVIIAIVLCVFLVIAIIIVIVICVKKNAKEKNTVEPDDHAMELKKKDARNNNQAKR